jgi:hypothetical protein
MVKKDSDSMPIPARCIESWVGDNALFIAQTLQARDRRMKEVPAKREEYLRKGLIRKRADSERTTLAAVDAADIQVEIGDMVSILVNSARVEDDGQVTFGAPVRKTGVNSEELSLARTPLRVAGECSFLCESQSITIADTSFWSLLWEVNQTITRREGAGSNSALEESYTRLVKDGAFIRTMRNENVIAMSKTNQSCRISGGMVSDREMLGAILEPGEYIVPGPLDEWLEASFGVEKRGFTDAERKEIGAIYKNDLKVTFFKPHAWSRAYRIEAHTIRLQDEAWLMALLSAVDYHTKASHLPEPWPQFLADFVTKQISGIGELYGALNFHRTPYFDPSRASRMMWRSA